MHVECRAQLSRARVRREPAKICKVATRPGGRAARHASRKVDSRKQLVGRSGRDVRQCTHKRPGLAFGVHSHDRHRQVRKRHLCARRSDCGLSQVDNCMLLDRVAAALLVWRSSSTAALLRHCATQAALLTECPALALCVDAHTQRARMHTSPSPKPNRGTRTPYVDLALPICDPPHGPVRACQ